MDAPFIVFNRVTKRFAGVTALKNVSLSIARGECHGLMGENGAGKSTLGKSLAGIYKPDEGHFVIDGQPVNFRSPRDAMAAGIGMVHQELAFCPDLSVAENLCMGVYPRRMGLFIDRGAMRQKAIKLLAAIGVQMDVNRPMRELSTAQEQLVQIASAVGLDARVLVFDEPTSSLSEPEAQALFKLIESLRVRGVTTIYVSHRMPEVFRLCDRISVLRDGEYVGTLTREEASQDAVVRMMVGRSVESYQRTAIPLAARSEAPLLRVRGLATPGWFRDVSFDIRTGEIVGLAGLVGAGRSEVAKAIFGLDGRATGTIELDGKPLKLGSIRQAMRRGVALVPEDRKRQGLVLMMSGRANNSMASLKELRRSGMLDFDGERKLATRFFHQLSVKSPSIDSIVAGLSGGNQQKIALAKWLARSPRLLIVDEPTRGVDIGAKAAIHRILDELAQRGTAILMISSELPELLGSADRIIVMREGRLVGEVTKANATQESVLRLMTGVETAATN